MNSRRLHAKTALVLLLAASSLQTTGCASMEAVLAAFDAFSAGLLAAGQAAGAVDAKEAQIASAVFNTVGSALGATSASLAASDAAGAFDPDPEEGDSEEEDPTVTTYADPAAVAGDATETGTDPVEADPDTAGTNAETVDTDGLDPAGTDAA